MTRTLIFITAVAGLLGGCGFHLRGSDPMDIDIGKVLLRSQRAGSALNLVRNQLTINQVPIVNSPKEADVVLTLKDERFDRRVLSVDPRTGKVREYELAYRVNFDVALPDGTALQTNQTIDLLRDYVFDESSALGKFEEENVLRQEMADNAAEAILRRVQAIRSHAKVQPKTGITQPLPQAPATNPAPDAD